MQPTKYKSIKAFTLGELLTVMAVLGILAFLVLGVAVKCIGFSGISYSEGQRTGTVYKISKKGAFWKTWEGELSLNLRTANSDGIVVNQIFAFSVADEGVAHQIEEAAQLAQPVTLKYEQFLMRGYRYGSTSYNVTGVALPGQK